VYTPNTAGQPSRSFGGFEAVTLYRRLPGGSFDAGTLCLRTFQRAGNKDAPYDEQVRVKQRTTTFLLVPWQASPNREPDPKPDDRIQEADGTRWEVDRVRTDTLRQWHACDCTMEVNDTP
jgi:hypothetical protein